ncbi:hypothetical protein P170DRAFT_96281 [Aspergillus steynii IBT 23096]|uniref:Uncharacterized protein n=1 Tax=Aspergillus steynii IBT 23096 TaxID=1392250 RepID=A0A2I2GGS5_9EURO|nr:uncharacterized protein P170DRAFT_96281 [Aspergillus steynii IBT 23096]PLB52081.1 hypothetical protein P170DRAFT_96281 [Aspergillus steynii IBT 23096]
MSWELQAAEEPSQLTIMFRFLLGLLFSALREAFFPSTLFRWSNTNRPDEDFAPITHRVHLHHVNHFADTANAVLNLSLRE